MAHIYSPLWWGHTENQGPQRGNGLLKVTRLLYYTGETRAQSPPAPTSEGNRVVLTVVKILGSDDTWIEILVLPLTSCLRPGSFFNPLRFNSFIYKMG